MPGLIVIEDDRVFGELIAEIASLAGFETDVVTSLQQFSEAYTRREPELITLDVSMPDADGFEMVDELVKLNCRSKIIIISGHDEKIMDGAVTFARAKGLDIIETLRKPIDVEVFEKLLITTIQ